MKQWLRLVVCLCAIGPAAADAPEGGMYHSLKLATGLRYADNPGYDGQGDANWVAMSSLRYAMVTKTRRSVLEFKLLGDAINTRLARGEARLSFRRKSASSLFGVRAFVRRADGGFIDRIPEEGARRRLVDVSEPGRRVTNFGLSTGLETGVGRMVGTRFALRALHRRSSGAGVVPISRSRRFDGSAALILRPNKRTEISGGFDYLRQKFEGAAARSDRHLSTGVSVTTEQTRQVTLEGGLAWREITSDATTGRTQRSGPEWHLAVHHAKSWGRLSVAAEQSQYLTGRATSLRLTAEYGDAEATGMWVKGWVGAIDVPAGGTDAIFGLNAALSIADETLSLSVSRDYTAGLSDGLERLATVGRLDFTRELTARHNLYIAGEVARIGSTSVQASRRVATFEASISTELTPSFALRGGVLYRERAGGIAGAAQDRSIYLTLEHLREAKG